MAKRKAAVNDIIYELDNDDIEQSSDEECKGSKINRLETKNTTTTFDDINTTGESITEVITIDSSIDAACAIECPGKTQNGGKTPPEELVESCPSTMHDVKSQNALDIDVDDNHRSSTEYCKTTIFNEDIVVDSPVSNTDLGVVGCENRTPLVTVRFADIHFARMYKKQIKKFMVKLIKLHNSDDLLQSDNDTDLELDVWPEDLEEEFEELNIEQKNTEPEDDLFFVDTAPGNDVQVDIPKYSQVSHLICNIPKKEATPPPVLRRGPMCFNCDGAHALRECRQPRDNFRIAEKRKNMTTRMGRYHVEDEQKYGHLIPGRISGQLRHALGLKRHEIPLHIYRMRVLGYPPGWLEEARISHSGIIMFDSTGNPIQDPEEEEGEVCEAKSKDKFDIKKILDFPGFNVPASSRYKEDAHLYGLPLISEQDSKMAMLQMLAPNAMKAYKRKKLTFFPSATATPVQGPAEMELDSGDEFVEFPSVPPLPDEAPPPQPPPPDLPPPPPNEPAPEIIADSLNSQQSEATESLKENSQTDTQDGSEDDIEVIEVLKVKDIPIPSDDLITVDEDCGNESQASTVVSRRSSLTLEDLEKKKQLLLDALDSNSITSADYVDLSENEDNEEEMAVKNDELKEQTTVTDTNDIANINSQMSTASSSETSNSPMPHNKPILGNISSDDTNPRTPESKTGHVKGTAYGTPVLNIASPFVKLPSDDKFAKDICDVINFENLPNSIGKYKQICSLLKKVKSEVDRIQDS